MKKDVHPKINETTITPSAADYFRAHVKIPRLTPYFGIGWGHQPQETGLGFVADVGVSIGKAKGPCGHITGTKKRRIFPFKAKHGKWTLQYDTSKKYHRGTSKTKYPWATVTVRVRSISIR